VGQQGPPGLGHDHAAAHPLEQRSAELTLQHLDLPAARGPGAAQTLRGPREAAEPRDGHEGLELVDGQDGPIPMTNDRGQLYAFDG